jgi:hypothetical protein
VTGATWSLPSLRTDSVNRGCCISLLTLAMVVLAGLIEFFRFFISRNIYTDFAKSGHNSSPGRSKIGSFGS